MEQYVGLDVSQQETAICVIDGAGVKLWEGTCRSTPYVIAGVFKRRAPAATRVGMETGPLAVWHWHALKRLGIPLVCLHARHAKAALSLQANKTDRNDAHGLAQVRAHWLVSSRGHEEPGQPRVAYGPPGAPASPRHAHDSV